MIYDKNSQHTMNRGKLLLYKEHQQPVTNIILKMRN